MKGKITIELTTETPDSGSGMPELGHNAYWIKKQLMDLVYTDKSGNETRISDNYEVTRLETSAG